MQQAIDLHGVRLELTVGDIVDQPDVDAVVNAANAQLLPGGGVAGAIHAAAGRGLADEATQHAPLQPSECVCTGAHDLPNQHVLHALGPVYGVDEPSDELLAATYRNTLRVAEEHQIPSVAFPAISTGAFGYPMDEAARVALTAITDVATEGLAHVRLVRLVLLDQRAWQVHADALAAIQR